MINYYLLTKPGIILGNLLTVAAGFLLASKGQMHLTLFLATLLGLGLIIASASVFNNYIDRALDQKMARTRQRPLARGLISGPQAIGFAIVLGTAGALMLFFYTNLLALSVAALGFFDYVILYSLWKSRTIYGTAIGSIAGAVPPVVGYCAVSNQLDLGALILFAMLVLWQMPHFFAIAFYHFEDYRAAGIPVLPVLKGSIRTKIHMLLYILGFLAVALLLPFFNYTGFLFFLVALLFGAVWFALALKGFSSRDDQLWGRRMFQWSLLLIVSLCAVIPFDVV